MTATSSQAPVSSGWLRNRSAARARSSDVTITVTGLDRTSACAAPRFRRPCAAARAHGGRDYQRSSVIPPGSGSLFVRENWRPRVDFSLDDVASSYTTPALTAITTQNHHFLYC